MTQRPDLRLERSLLRAGARVVAGMDEVGRGALAGPVSVGVVAVDVTTRSGPPGVADSKLLSPAAREALLPALGRWGVARAVGHASAAEIDAVGIVAALRLAGTRALAALDVAVDLVVLDGSHDWLSVRDELDLWGGDGGGGAAGAPAPAVRTLVKADRRCSSVAAASVLAKCERDALMVALAAEHPEYRWAENKGYGAPEHLAALRALGPSALHRRSWRLPVAQGVEAGDGAPAADGQGLESGEPAPGRDEPGTGRDEPADGLVARWSMMDA